MELGHDHQPPTRTQQGRHVGEHSGRFRRLTQHHRNHRRVDRSALQPNEN